jgi:hypothetical protein
LSNHIVAPVAERKSTLPLKRTLPFVINQPAVKEVQLNTRLAESVSFFVPSVYGTLASVNQLNIGLAVIV